MRASSARRTPRVGMQYAVEEAARGALTILPSNWKTVRSRRCANTRRGIVQAQADGLRVTLTAEMCSCTHSREKPVPEHVEVLVRLVLAEGAIIPAPAVPAPVLAAISIRLNRVQGHRSCMTVPSCSRASSLTSVRVGLCAASCAAPAADPTRSQVKCCLVTLSQ